MNKEKIDLFKYIDNFNKYKQVESVLTYGEKESIKDPYITIAIPTYKRNSLLKEAIDSALNQINSDCEFEVIVVDNEVKIGVETETEKLIKSYSDKRLLYYKNEENIGMFGNWNRCIELSRGKWIAFLHDDDLLKADYICKITHLIARKRNIGAILASFETIGVHHKKQKQELNNLKQVLKQLFLKIGKTKLMRIRTIDSQISDSNMYGAPTCGSIFNREYAIKEGGFNEEFFPSADWFYMFKFNKSYKVYVTLDILGYYRFLVNESLNPNTLREFIIDKANFSEFNSRHSLIGLIMYKLFRYEQHFVTVKASIKQDKSSSIKPEEFNYLCEYKIRPVRLYIYKIINILYLRLRKVSALILG